MGIFNKSFYRYSDRNFVSIRANELQDGDSLAVGSWAGNAYGAVPLEWVVNSGGEVIVVMYILPDGACAKSAKSVEVEVTWDGSKAKVEVTQYFEPRHKVLVLK